MYYGYNGFIQNQAYVQKNKTGCCLPLFTRLPFLFFR